jgi:phage terminase large subunit
MEYHIIDYVDDEGLSLPQYFKILADKPYLYGMHNLPHDAGSQPQLATGKTIEEQAIEIVGAHKVKIIPMQSVKSQIASARLILDRCWFDKDKCADGLNGLRHYRFPPKGISGVEHDKPMHDWASHPGSAFQYFAVGIADQQFTDNKPIYAPTPAPSRSSAWV